MSSTTSRSSQRGQSLVIFALSLVVLFGFAALAFDIGQMLLDRRSEQNAADAAALAGGRYVVEPACFAAPSVANCTNAVSEALRVAFINGYGDGTSNNVQAANGSTVKVQIPPGAESEFAGQPGFIEVEIGSNRGSIFAGVLGITGQRVAVLATAANRSGVAADYSMIALNPSECSAAKFGGSGTVSVSGNIQVDSSATCPQGAFNQGGASSVEVTSEGGVIDVVGDASCATGHCTPDPSTGQPYVPDPLLSLPAPGLPALPAPVVELSGTAAIPAGCPGGSSPATALAPATCAFNNSYNGTTWLLSPGYYPGGFQFLKGTFFLRPGLYYIGGGGLDAGGGGANIYTVSASWSSTTPPTTCQQTSTIDCITTFPPTPFDCAPKSFAKCGGVLLYNTDDPTATSGGASVRDMQPISLNGSAAVIHLYPIQDAGPYTNIVVFQDRNLPGATSGDLQLNGNGSNLYVQGTIYEPNGYVAVQGTGNLGPSQIIADTFSVTGSGTLAVGYNQDLVAQLIAVGLVE